jgi:glutamine synthetase
VDEKGGPLSICPRQLLKRVVAECRSLGYEAVVGSEFEWFNFKETPESLREKNYRNLTPLTPGMFGYSILRSSMESDYFNSLIDLTRDFGIPLEGLHTETGPGVYEAAIACTDALEAGDRAVLFKTAAKEIANKFGVTATFMARWNSELPGCSGHLHQSLTKNGRNVFYDAKSGMSDTLKHFIAGQLHCLPDILPMFAPTVNSYKRLVEGFWAPTKVTWAVDNRTVALRFIPGSEKSTRVEFRTPGSDMNPYLSIAASLAAGLYGVKNKLGLEHKAIEGNGYAVSDAESLPATLEEASKKMMASDLAKELLGTDFVTHFGNSRLFEWRQYLQAVTDWELDRYFEII